MGRYKENARFRKPGMIPWRQKLPVIPYGRIDRINKQLPRNMYGDRAVDVKRLTGKWGVDKGAEDGEENIRVVENVFHRRSAVSLQGCM